MHLRDKVLAPNYTANSKTAAEHAITLRGAARSMLPDSHLYRLTMEAAEKAEQRAALHNTSRESEPPLPPFKERAQPRWTGRRGQSNARRRDPIHKRLTGHYGSNPYARP